MAKIYIGFSSPRKFKIGAELIKIWMNTPYSHAYIRFESNTIQSTVYHAAQGMVHFREDQNFLAENLVHEEFEIDVEESSRLNILRDCISLAGEKYGYGELLKILVSDIAHTIGINVTTYDGRGYICSELVGKMLIKHLGFIFNKPTHLLTPKDIYNCVERYVELGS